MKYQILQHTADWKIKGYGRNLAELFSNLAEAMYGIIAPEQKLKDKKTKDPLGLARDRQRSKHQFSITVKGDSAETLLVNFLNELLFLTATKKQLYSNFQFSQISAIHLVCSAQTSPLLQPALEIKAATFHDLKIEKVNNLLQATVVFDI